MKPKIELAQIAARMGFPIAGFVKDIYEDAVICIFSSLEQESDVIGRVLHSNTGIRAVGTNGRSIYDDVIMSFVVLTKDGIQVPHAYGNYHPCYFALPENTKNNYQINQGVNA